MTPMTSPSSGVDPRRQARPHRCECGREHQALSELVDRGEGPSEMCVAECPAVILACNDQLYCNGEESRLSITRASAARRLPRQTTSHVRKTSVMKITMSSSSSPMTGVRPIISAWRDGSTTLGGCIEQPQTPCCGDDNLDTNEEGRRQHYRVMAVVTIAAVNVR